MNPFLRKKSVLSPKKQVYKNFIDYSNYRSEFIKWLKDRNNNVKYTKDIISYLDKYLLGNVIYSPLEVSKIRRRASSKKSITIAIRTLLNYCEEMDLLDEDFIMKLRKPLKTIRSNPDNYIPSDKKILETYKKINPKYKVLFKLLLFSGIRGTEAIQFFKEYDRDKVEIKGNVARYPLFSIRKNKRSYFVYFPAKMIDEIERKEYTARGISHAFIRAGLPSKYLRKWNYNFLIMNNVPESVADFIQGRAPVSIGSMHYLAKVKQADYWYAQVVNTLVKIFGPKDTGF